MVVCFSSSCRLMPFTPNGVQECQPVRGVPKAWSLSECVLILTDSRTFNSKRPTSSLLAVRRPPALTSSSNCLGKVHLLWPVVETYKQLLLQSGR